MVFDNNIPRSSTKRQRVVPPSTHILEEREERGEIMQMRNCGSPFLSLPSPIPTHWAPSKFLMPEAELHVRLPVELPFPHSLTLSRRRLNGIQMTIKIPPSCGSHASSLRDVGSFCTPTRPRSSREPRDFEYAFHFAQNKDQQTKRHAFLFPPTLPSFLALVVMLVCFFALVMDHTAVH